MNEFKFACPVCGQHITCAATAAGSQMECPTCFRKIVVPRVPRDPNSKLVLATSEVGQHPKTSITTSETRSLSARRFPTATVALVVILLALVAGAVVFRDKLLPSPATAPDADALAGAPKGWVTDTNWTLNLAGHKIPEAPVTGRIHGHSFTLSRATIQGGTLNLRQGPKWPPDLGVTVYLFANQGEDLAGKTVNLGATRTNSPRVTLRWKDEQDKAVNRTLRSGYALRVEFGAVKDGRLPGKIYLCLPDEPKSWIAGNFSAEIRRPQPAKQPAQTAPKP